MKRFFNSRHCAFLGLAAVLLAAMAVRAQSGSSPSPAQAPSNPDQNSHNSQPLPLKPDVPGMGRNHRLILKDGSYQMVRDYQIVGDRVRYLSQERGDWEELPADLVDWDATRKWEKEHENPTQQDTSPAMKEAEDLDKEESAERRDQSARMPQVAEGLELPDEDGVFILDTYHGTPELVRLRSSELAINSRSHKGVAVLNPQATQRAHLELDGAHARAHLHIDDPVIFMSLGVDDEREPVLTHPITVNTGGAKAVNGDHGAHSAQSEFVIVRVDERQAVRIVGAIRVDPSGNVTQNDDTILTKVETMPGKRWLRVTPLEKLVLGEYALVEIVSPTEINESVWDFRVDPGTGDNPDSIGPIFKQPRE